MLKPIREGYTITINLPEETGYDNYSVKCTYRYNRKREKYSLSMHLLRSGSTDEFKIDSQKIDTQFISGTKENIEENICRIVEQASLSGYFTHYIKKFEHTYKCFEYGSKFYKESNCDVDQG